MNIKSVDINHDAEQLANHGSETIAKGSKSFAMASLLFGDEMRKDVQMLYAWCRHCDDVIDGQLLGEDAPDAQLSDEEQARRLDLLRKNTQLALSGVAIGEPAFDGFSLVAQKHNMPAQYPMDLLNGFAMDVDSRIYNTMDETLSYCYGVAGCVGVMMAIVMGVSPEDETTLDRACDLGLAFQLTNICRDIIDDAKADRIYLPNDILYKAQIDPSPLGVMMVDNREKLALVARDVLQDAELYYASAMQGVRMLPPRAGAAISAARNVYGDIGHIIKKRGANAWDDRVYTSKPRKIWRAIMGIAMGAPQRKILGNRPMKPRGDLWQRPKN